MNLNNQEIPVDLKHLEIFTDGSPDEEKELFDLFLEQLEISLKELEKNLIEDDEGDWKKTAHRLKGAAASLGANPLFDVCKVAEGSFESSQEIKQKLFLDIRKKSKDVHIFLIKRMKSNPI